MSFEADLEYANNVLRIRSSMEDGTIVTKDGIFLFSARQGCNEFSIDFCGTKFVIGYLERRPESKMLNFSTFGEIYFNTRSNFVQVGSKQELIKLSNDVMDEAWHFQNSLIYTPSVLRDLMIFNTLKMVQTEYEFFQLKVRWIDSIIERL